MNCSKISAVIAILCGIFAFCSGSSSVITLNHDNFEQLVTSNKEFWLVHFHGSGCDQCDKFNPELEKFADAFLGVIKVGRVDAQKEETLANEYNIKGPMAIMIFGANKKNPKVYYGQTNIKDITDYVLNYIKKTTLKKLGFYTEPVSEVVVLNDKNFDGVVLQSQEPWLVGFFAPWCGHCKKLKPEWERAAIEMKGKVMFGTVDSMDNKTKEYDIKKFPTILFFPRGPKLENFQPEIYENGRTSHEIVEWAMEKYVNSLPVPEIVEITSEKVLINTCQNTPLCILTFLPQIIECQANCRQNYLEILKKVANKYKKNNWGWVWSEGGSQNDLERALGVEGIGYPTTAVANVKKQKYAHFKGSFTAENIEAFLKDVISGKKVNYYDIKTQEMPKINEITPWDGKDPEIPPTTFEENEAVKEEL